MPDPDDADPALAAQRLALAVEALIWILRDDPRVSRAYDAWIARLFAGSAAVGGGRRVILFDAVLAAMRQNQPDDLVALTRVVTDDLRIGMYAEWLPSFLLADFGEQLKGQLTGQPSGIRLTPELSTLPASHRRLKYDGRFVAEHVRDYYRAEIKERPDKLYAIAKDWRDAKHAAGVHVGGKKTARVDVAGVKRRIKVAKEWLAAIVVAPKSYLPPSVDL